MAQQNKSIKAFKLLFNHINTAELMNDSINFIVIKIVCKYCSKLETESKTTYLKLVRKQ